MSRIVAVPIPYTCRVCGRETTIYVSPDETEEGLAIDLDGILRLTKTDCPQCETDRVHVVDESRIGESE